MKKVNVRIRKTPDFLEIGQANCYLYENNDIRIFGSLNVNRSDCRGHRTAAVCANLCNEEGKIVFVFNVYHSTKYNLTTNAYYSFEHHCVDITRFFGLDELAYVELYVVLDV